MCKNSAIITNTTIGNVFDMSVLDKVLECEKIAGAGIDIYEKDLPLLLEHPLLKAHSCIVSLYIFGMQQENLLIFELKL